mmetsp:Transcript_69204/g.200459  ORF Transcript_69204/g.200459 Transcript_69204/m.200459 type:complete len:391 (-) Transcript_69204:631-1803(-)
MVDTGRLPLPGHRRPRASQLVHPRLRPQDHGPRGGDEELLREIHRSASGRRVGAVRLLLTGSHPDAGEHCVSGSGHHPLGLTCAPGRVLGRRYGVLHVRFARLQVWLPQDMPARQSAHLGPCLAAARGARRVADVARGLGRVPHPLGRHSGGLGLGHALRLVQPRQRERGMGGDFEAPLPAHHIGTGARVVEPRRATGGRQRGGAGRRRAPSVNHSLQLRALHRHAVLTLGGLQRGRAVHRQVAGEGGFLCRATADPLAHRPFARARGGLDFDCAGVGGIGLMLRDLVPRVRAHDRHDLPKLRGHLPAAAQSAAEGVRPAHGHVPMLRRMALDIGLLAGLVVEQPEEVLPELRQELREALYIHDDVVLRHHLGLEALCVVSLLVVDVVRG